MGLGFQDGLSPFLLIIAIVFVLLLSFFAKSARDVFVNGIYYFVGCYFVLVAIFLGLVDRIPQVLLSPIVFQCVYLVVSIVVLIFALKLFKVWVKSLNGQGDVVFQKQKPFFLKDEYLISSKKTSKKILFFLLGSIVAYLTYFWPQNYFLYLLNLDPLQKKQFGRAFFHLALYLLFLLWPFFCVWSFLLSAKFLSVKNFCIKNYARISLFTAAFMFGVSAATFYLIWRI